MRGKYKVNEWNYMKLMEIAGKILYRGITDKNLPNRYPGVYYTEFEELAKWYSRGNGKVLIRKDIPSNPLIIDNIQKWPQGKKQQFLNKLEQFVNGAIPLEDTQLYDNIVDNQTDFAYPTQLDVDFLKSLSYDSVFYSIEGGQKVNSWFIFS
jgi:hypothetical protein